MGGISEEERRGKLNILISQRRKIEITKKVTVKKENIRQKGKDDLKNRERTNYRGAFAGD